MHVLVTGTDGSILGVVLAPFLLKRGYDIFASRAYTRLKQIQHLRATSQLDEHFFW